MGLVHAADQPIKWNYIIEEKHITDDTRVGYTWWVVYQQSVNIATGKPLDIHEICRTRTRHEANKIRDMYIAVCPADKRMPKLRSMEERKHRERVANIRAITLNNCQMLNLIEALFKEAGMSADAFHNALVKVAAPTVQAVRPHVDTSKDAPMKPPGDPEAVVAERVFELGAIKS